MSATLDKIVAEWSALDPNYERLGQYFCNRYIKSYVFHNDIDLFFIENIEECKAGIESWLIDHQYTDSMPPRISNL